MAYDYLWDKKSVKTNQDFKGQFSLKMEDRTVNMNLWFKGEENREVFSAMSPKSTAFRHGLLPEALNNNPIPTLVVKQNGEAWSHPFVAIYEPALNGGSDIEKVDYFGENESVGIIVKQKNGKKDIIFSTTSSDKDLNKNGFFIKVTYAVVSINGDDFSMFLGDGKTIGNSTYTINIESGDSSVALKQEKEKLYITAQYPIEFAVRVQDKIKKATITDASGKEYIGTYEGKTKTVMFHLPELAFQAIKMNLN
jgi:hypothetical protein